MPSFMGRWKALRPEIRPVPPARLLIPAVRTAFAKIILARPSSDTVEET
jgi:hypothetical protein